MIVVVLVALASAVMLTVALTSRAATGRRLRRIERHLAEIATHLGVPEREHSDLIALVDAGRTAQAVATHRRRTGMSIVDAKRFVDEIAQGPAKHG